MERRLLLLEGEMQRGELLCTDEGCYVLCSVDVPMWDGGVKKVWLCSESGGRVLLGTLVPEQGRFRLRRRISHSSLRCCGVARPDWAQVNPQGTAREWHSLDSLSLADRELSGLLKGCPHGLWKREEQRLLLRFPWHPGEAVPMMSLFCFACPRDGWWEITMEDVLFSPSVSTGWAPGGITRGGNE